MWYKGIATEKLKSLSRKAKLKRKKSATTFVIISLCSV